MPRRPTAQQRAKIAARAHGYCEYCYSPSHFATQSFSVEHIIPWAKGGRTTLANLALACPGCNSFKHVKTEWPDPLTDKRVALFHPRQQKWRDHFVWNDDFNLIIGLTPTGRATVEALQLNRTGLVNLRRALLAIEEHPPLVLDTGGE